MNNKLKININTFFNDWLRQNKDRFAVQLYSTPNKKDNSYYFEGISNDLISVFVHRSSIDIPVYYDGVKFDLVYHMEITPKYDKSKGFYCEWCKEPKYYPSIEELYIKHSFEDMLEWANTKLKNSRYVEVCFFGDRDTAWAYLDIDVTMKKKFKDLKNKIISKKSTELKTRINLWQ